MSTKALYGWEMREDDPDKRRTPYPRSYNIKQLWQRSHEILGLALQGYDHKRIAQLLGINPETVGATINSDLGKQKLSELRERRDEGIVEVSKKVAELSAKALKVYEEIFDSETVSYNLKKDAADTVLMDLGGHRTPTKVDTRHLHAHATLEEIEEFKKRGIAAARSAGMLVELPEEEVIDIETVK